MGYVDIHSHVLYGLDDGAKTREDSVAMLEMAERSGTSDIVATPHANSRYPFQPDLVAARIEELGAATSVRIHPGCDFHLQFDNIEDAVAHPEKYTINHKGYLLVEFPEVGTFHGADAILERLLDTGMVPIISHPERNEHLRKHPDNLARWIATGCYVQVTASSFTGLFGRAARNAAHDLLTRGLIHFVASDAHDTTFRTTSLRQAYAALADAVGEDVIGPLFVENPKAVLEGGSIEFELPARATKARRWYQFWSR